MQWNEQFDQVMENLSGSGAFLTVDGPQGINTMTIGWGFIGFMWKKPCVLAVVRPQRYSRELLDQSDSFTISVPFGTMKDALAACGSKSGRDFDKSTIVEYASAKSIQSKVIRGCDMYYECKKLYKDPMDGGAMPADIVKRWYQEDYHIVYIGEIVDVYGKE